MFKKVLLSDDLGSINQGVFMTIRELGIKDIKQVQYCDDAYLRIKKASLDNEPFDLLITDLSFQRDYREQSFSSGEELIKILKSEFPDLKIIAFSVDDRLQKIRTLIHTYHIEAYVGKGRKGLQELTAAIQKVYEGKTYLSPHLEHALSHKSELEIDDFDIYLIKLLSEGLSQDDISEKFKSDKLMPNSVSSIEKKITKLRIHLR